MTTEPIPTNPNPSVSFEQLGVAPLFLDILERKGIVQPTPIQHQAIPVALQGKDIIGIAQTGTGKTWAYGLPMLQRLMNDKGRALILVPTRELAEQVNESLSLFTPAAGIRTAVFIGGASFERQREMIRRDPRILIATPGRLNDHLERGTVTLRSVNILVLDEADQMLDMGFKPQIDRIIAHVPKERQTLLFSATMAHEIVKLATTTMRLPLRIEVAPQGTAAEKVEQELFIVRKDEKLRLLETLLEKHTGTVLVFSRTKHGAKKITRVIRAMGHSAAEIHANRSLSQRREALDGFKKGKYRVLIATDIAARGIDVTGITVVVNFDLPNDPSDYVHRIGRTARAGRDGIAISFASPDQAMEIRRIEKLIRFTLNRKPLPVLAPPRAPMAEDRNDMDAARPYGSFTGGRKPFGGSGGGRPPYRGGGQKRRY